MAKAKSHIPPGFHSIAPYFHVSDAAAFLDFVKSVFGAEERFRSTTPDGKIMHASARIGDSMIEVSDANAQWPTMPCAVHVYVHDTDAVYRKALAAGATSLYGPADMFYGERSGGVRDPFGNNWYIATHVEDVPADELARRERAFRDKQAQQTQQQ